jgi:hypothetical protein
VRNLSITMCIMVLSCWPARAEDKPIGTPEELAASLKARGPARAKAIAIIDHVQSVARDFVTYDHYSAAGDLLPRSFPLGKTGWVPATACCAQDRRSGMCRVDPAVWNKGPWKELRLSPKSPLPFQIRYTSTGTGTKASYRLELRADPGCLGRPMELILEGKIERGGWVATRTLAPL